MAEYTSDASVSGAIQRGNQPQLLRIPPWLKEIAGVMVGCFAFSFPLIVALALQGRPANDTTGSYQPRNPYSLKSHEKPLHAPIETPHKMIFTL